MSPAPIYTILTNINKVCDWKINKYKNRRGVNADISNVNILSESLAEIYK